MMDAKPKLVIEVCVDSLESAIAAVEGGADRLEVCSAIGMGGGMTPSTGLVKSIRSKYFDIPIMAMIRPRIGDFCFSESDMEVMLQDILEFKNASVYGVVIGVLTPESKVDVERTRRLVETAKPMQVTFHRAFDTTADLDAATLDITSIGDIQRILTSAGQPRVLDALPRLKALAGLCTSTHSGCSILPGSGINPSTVETVVSELWPLGITEYHLSGGGWVDGLVVKEKSRKAGLGMGYHDDNEWKIWKTDQETIKAVRAAARKTIDSFQ